VIACTARSAHSRQCSRSNSSQQRPHQEGQYAYCGKSGSTCPTGMAANASATSGAVGPGNYRANDVQRRTGVDQSADQVQQALRVGKSAEKQVRSAHAPPRVQPLGHTGMPLRRDQWRLVQRASTADPERPEPKSHSASASPQVHGGSPPQAIGQTAPRSHNFKYPGLAARLVLDELAFALTNGLHWSGWRAACRRPQGLSRPDASPARFAGNAVEPP